MRSWKAKLTFFVALALPLAALASTAAAKCPGCPFCP
jgi:hypothetical protein